MPSKQPDMVIQQRHEAAMTIIHQVDPKDRPLILAYVVAGTDRLRELEEQGRGIHSYGSAEEPALISAGDTKK
jgi:hypothetical protein